MIKDLNDFGTALFAHSNILVSELTGSVFSGMFTYAAYTILMESVIFNNY